MSVHLPIQMYPKLSNMEFLQKTDEMTTNKKSSPWYGNTNRYCWYRSWSPLSSPCRLRTGSSLSNSSSRRSTSSYRTQGDKTGVGQRSWEELSTTSWRKCSTIQQTAIKDHGLTVSSSAFSSSEVELWSGWQSPRCSFNMYSSCLLISPLLFWGHNRVQHVTVTSKYWVVVFSQPTRIKLIKHLLQQQNHMVAKMEDCWEMINISRNVFHEHTAGYTMYEYTQISPIIDFVQKYRGNWKEWRFSVVKIEVEVFMVSQSTRPCLLSWSSDRIHIKNYKI